MWLQFKKIASIAEIEVGKQIDVIGIITSVTAPRRITKRNGDEVDNRRITVKDDSNCSIEVRTPVKDSSNRGVGDFVG